MCFIDMESHNSLAALETTQPAAPGPFAIPRPQSTRWHHLHVLTDKGTSFVSISSTSTLDGKTSVGVDHSTAVVVAAVAVLAIVVGLVGVSVVLQGNLLLTLLPRRGVLLLLRNNLCWCRDRL